MTTLLLAVLALMQITPAQAERLKWVPNPRVTNSSWVADPSHHLHQATIDSLNSLLSTLSRETGTEMTVVAIDSTSGFEPFDVALALHRRWGVGQKGRDNGIVVLWVPTQRAVQVSIGYGLEGVLPDSRVGRVRDQHDLSGIQTWGVRCRDAGRRERDREHRSRGEGRARLDDVDDESGA